MRYFKLRLKFALQILFGPFRNFFLVNLSEKNMAKAILNEPYTVKVYPCNLHNYIIHVTIKQLAEAKDEIDMVLLKAGFEAQIMERIENDPKIPKE